MKRSLLLAVLGVITLAAPARTDDAEDASILVVRKLGGTLTRDNTAEKAVIGVDLSSPFASFKVRDAELKELAGIQQLQVLDLTDTKVSDVGLRALQAFKELRQLNLRGTKIGDAGLRELGGVKSLQKLYLRDLKITEAGLKHLAGLTQLETLDLLLTPVTDAGLKELAALTSLQGLGLSSTQVSDAGLKHLAKLKKLQRLQLSNTQVSDAGLADLAALKELQSLSLNNTYVTDAGTKDLAGLKQLQSLELRQTRVSDTGLKELAGLKALRTLCVSGRQITDAGLQELSALKQLQTLELVNTGVTDIGVAELRKKLPECAITQTKIKGVLLPPTSKTTVTPGRTIELEITHQRNYDEPPTICVPLSISQKDADVREVLVEVLGETTKLKASGQTLGQLTAPGLLTEHIPPAAADQVRRDLHFKLRSSPKAGTVTKAEVHLKNPNFVGYGFDAWQFKVGEHAELTQNYGKMPVLRYLHQRFDDSTDEKREQTCKVAHHLYSLVPSKGFNADPSSLTHSLLYGFDKITLAGGKECDIWRGRPGSTHQAHTAFLMTEPGGASGMTRVVARLRVAVDWHGPNNDIFAKEEREITIYGMGPKGTLVDFVSRLKTTGGVVKLRGDPHHAGLQFRPHIGAKEQKQDKQPAFPGKLDPRTYFLRPDGKGAPDSVRNWDPKTGQGPINLPWNASSFTVEGRRCTVAYLSHASNPGESRWGERPDGGLGCYFEYDLTEKNPLVVNYRIYLQFGELTQDRIESLSDAFRQPPTVKVTYPQ